MELIREIRTIYDNYDFDTEILAASIRTAEPRQAGGAGRRRRRHHPAGGAARPRQAPAHRQGARGLPRRLEEDRPDDLLTMILEHAILDVRPGETAAFEAALAEALPLIAASDGFLGLEVRPCVERPGAISSSSAGGASRTMTRASASPTATRRGGRSSIISMTRSRWSSITRIRSHE